MLAFRAIADDTPGCGQDNQMEHSAMAPADEVPDLTNGIHFEHPEEQRLNPLNLQQRRQDIAARKRIQACQRCKKKKLKCDSELPACRGCATAGQACTTIDLITRREYERSYIANLERRVHELQSAASNAFPASPSTGSRDELSHRNLNVEKAHSPAQSTSASQYVGHSSEINFTQLIISNLQARTLAAKTPKLTEALLSIRAGIAAGVTVTANVLPNASLALELLKSYLGGNHIFSPIISRKEVCALYQRVYQNSHTVSGIGAQRQLGSPSQQDFYRINMVFALGSVEMARKGQHEHSPMGYYVSAMHHFKSVPKIVSIDAAQNLLFVAEFTMLQDTGCSVWDIGRICMRTCLLLDLQREKPGTDSEAIGTQQQVFWVCYSIDRMASTTLGRPFSISDRDISVECRARSTSQDSSADEVTTTLEPSTLAQLPAENDYFVIQVQLRRLSSEISTYFYRLRRKRSGEELYTDIGRFLARIQDWRNMAALISNEDGILYHEPTWLDYMAAKERLSLARAAINFIVLGQSRVPKDLRDLCLGAGLSIIETYTSLFLAGRVTFSRMYFYILFSASVSCLYCLLVECKESIGLQAEKFDLSPNSSSKARVLRSLDLAVQVLGDIVHHLPDLRGYSEALQVVVSQMQGYQTAMGTEFVQQRSDAHDGLMTANPGQNVGNMNSMQEQFGDWSTQPFMNNLDWQSIGAEMWQFVEPEWMYSVGENGTFDGFDSMYRTGMQ